jgi:hypothetical protein
VTGLGQDLLEVVVADFGGHRAPLRRVGPGAREIIYEI